MGRRTIIVTKIALIFAALVAIANLVRADEPYAEILGVQHMHFTITSYSDGSVDVSPIGFLDARTARRVADRLGEIEAANRAVRRTSRRTAIIPAAQQPQVLAGTGTTARARCAGVASSTGLQCRNLATPGTLTCTHHQFTGNRTSP